MNKIVKIMLSFLLIMIIMPKNVVLKAQEEIINEITHKLPTTLEEIKSYNKATADYVKLQELLSSETRINWLFAGDSITQGVMWTNGMRRYTEYINQYLKTETINNIYRSNDVVMNTGVSSATSNDLMQHLSEILDDRNPQIVFITYAMNDGKNADNPTVTLEQFTQNLKTAIDRVRAIGAIPIIQTENYTALKNTNTSIEKYFSAEKQLAFENNVMILDFNQKWLEINHGNKTATTYLGDKNLHPSEKGHLHWAKFILSELDLLKQDSVLANLSDDDIELISTNPEIDTANLAFGFEHTKNQGLLNYNIQKLFDGKHIVSKDKDAIQISSLENANVTFRIKSSLPKTDETIVSFSDLTSLKKISIVLLKSGFIRVLQNLGTTDSFYTFTKPISDGGWHTMSVNFANNSLSVYVDGQLDANKKLSASAAVTMNKFNINTISIGGTKDVANPNGSNFFTGVIDYVDIYNNILRQEEINQNYPQNILVNSMVPFVNNLQSNTWVFIGGETTLGITNHLSTKNYVEALEEVIRWEYNNKNFISRMRFFINESKMNLSSAKILENYDNFVTKNKANLIFVMPEIVENGQLLETDVISFKSNIQTFIQKAKETNRQVVLLSPVSAETNITEYLQAMSDLAKDNMIPYIGINEYLNEIETRTHNVHNLWFTESKLNEEGHLALSKFILQEMKIVPNLTKTRILNKYYTKNKLNIEHGLVEVKAVIKEKNKVEFDLENILNQSPYFSNNLTIYENVGDNESNPVKIYDTNQIGNITLENVDENAHQFFVVATIDKKEEPLKVIIYFATPIGAIKTETPETETPEVVETPKPNEETTPINTLEKSEIRSNLEELVTEIETLLSQATEDELAGINIEKVNKILTEVKKSFKKSTTDTEYEILYKKLMLSLEVEPNVVPTPEIEKTDYSNLLTVSDANKISVLTDVDTLKTMLLTPEEVENETTKNIKLVITKRQASELNLKLEDYKIIEAYDIQLINTETQEAISELNHALKLKLRLENAGSDYVLLREHNGEISQLSLKIENNLDVVFESDKFSTYVIAKKVDISDESSAKEPTVEIRKEADKEVSEEANNKETDKEVLEEANSKEADKDVLQETNKEEKSEISKGVINEKVEQKQSLKNSAAVKSKITTNQSSIYESVIYSIIAVIILNYLRKRK